MPHDADYYRRLLERQYRDLAEAERIGVIYRAALDESVGQTLETILDELLRHPLCGRLQCRPQLYIHVDSTARFSTFGDVILIPPFELPDGSLGDDGHWRRIRAVLAHELGHMLSGDNHPAHRAADRTQRRNQRAERRADLIAAYLCGDGGQSLADWLTEKASQERQFAALVNRHSSWTERLEGNVRTLLDRSHPAVAERVAYLTEWSDRNRRGEPLPGVVLPDATARRALFQRGEEPRQRFNLPQR